MAAHYKDITTITDRGSIGPPAPLNILTIAMGRRSVMSTGLPVPTLRDRFASSHGAGCPPEVSVKSIKRNGLQMPRGFHSIFAH